MRRIVPFVVLIAVVACLNGWLEQRFHVRVLTLTIVWALAGVAWNLVAKAGQISLGHSAFVGMGAYGFTILLRGDGTSPWIGMAVGMGVAAVVALAIGLPTFRLRGFYFTLATISFPLIMELLVSHYGDPELTVPFHPESEWKFMEFSDPHTYVWVGLGMLVVALVISELIDLTSFGFALRAVRDNEVLARAVGIRTVAWKSAAFMIPAALSAAMAVLWVKAVLRVTVAEEVFGANRVLSDVAFSVDVGRRVGIIGPNGAGKTTLFNIMTAHLRADAGRILFKGVPVDRMRAPRRYELGISRTFQVPQGFHLMSPQVHLRPSCPSPE